MLCKQCVGFRQRLFIVQTFDIMPSRKVELCKLPLPGSLHRRGQAGRSHRVFGQHTQPSWYRRALLGHSVASLNCDFVRYRFCSMEVPPYVSTLLHPGPERMLFPPEAGVMTIWVLIISCIAETCEMTPMSLPSLWRLERVFRAVSSEASSKDSQNLHQGKANPHDPSCWPSWKALGQA